MYQEEDYVIIDQSEYVEHVKAECFCCDEDVTHRHYLIEGCRSKQQFYVDIYYGDYTNVYVPIDNDWEYDSPRSGGGRKYLYDLTDRGILNLVRQNLILRHTNLLNYAGYDLLFPGYRETYEFALREQDDDSYDDSWHSIDQLLAEKPVYFLG